jgi:hypothetical protein
MPYTVVHCGTGNIGAVALKTILGRDDLELVGHYVSAPGKAGRDSGELVGLPPVGSLQPTTGPNCMPLAQIA